MFLANNITMAQLIQRDSDGKNLAFQYNDGDINDTYDCGRDGDRYVYGYSEFK